jgi:hypothetical protein
MVAPLDYARARIKSSNRARRIAECNTVGTVTCENRLMKWCSQCKTFLSFDSFAASVARRAKGGLCKLCRREYSKAYYRRNRALLNQNRLRRQRQYRARNRKRLTGYLASHPCRDCGEADTRVLEFDHVTGNKGGNVSNLVREGWAWQRIVSEIAKCEVRCANCHRRKTVEQLRWPHAIGA